MNVCEGIETGNCEFFEGQTRNVEKRFSYHDMWSMKGN
jgi:hypothetical protein